MIEIAITFLIIAVAAGVVGFTGMARGLSRFAVIIFGVFAVLALLLFILYFAGADTAHNP